jgi:RHH-type transcriptional regulator, proline utilization regulon repressor / proline dehydrogenase / delta 1-pyrroline-5-carboxylate dehydrogenase
MEMLEGAMDALGSGDPWDPATDVGPVIDAEAHTGISSYLSDQEERLVKALPTPAQGRFVGPSIVAVPGIEALEREIFGPVLHVASYRAADLDRVVAAINARGYGLTFGMHSRIDDRVESVTARVAAGNLYVNRNQIGAIVGSQPFGGEGLSGTGPKAGGPAYVPRMTSPAAAEAGEPSGPFHGAEAIAAAFGRLAPEGAPLATERLHALARRLPTAAMAGLRPDTFAPLDLPGPTGESNRLRFVPRGRVLCLGTGTAAAQGQIARALAAGNAVVLVSAEARFVVEPLVADGFAIAALDGQPDPAALAAVPGLGLVVAEGPEAWRGELRRALAARPGPIVALERGAGAAHRYVLERHLCIDTTAAGGNASLLAAEA